MASVSPFQLYDNDVYMPCDCFEWMMSYSAGAVVFILFRLNFSSVPKTLTKGRTLFNHVTHTHKHTSKCLIFTKHSSTVSILLFESIQFWGKNKHRARQSVFLSPLSTSQHGHCALQLEYPPPLLSLSPSPSSFFFFRHRVTGVIFLPTFFFVGVSEKLFGYPHFFLPLTFSFSRAHYIRITLITHIYAYFVAYYIIRNCHRTHTCFSCCVLIVTHFFF